MYVPVSTKDPKKLTMKSVGECVFCDQEWYRHGFDEDDLDEGIYLIHERVPLQTAKRLGIPSVVNKTLEAEDLGQAYGQSEPLTRRLHNILRDYSDGLAVLKELIQNADDAGATEIQFSVRRATE